MKEKEVIKELTELMGYPATEELVLRRLNSPIQYPNLIDAMWKFIKKHVIEENT